MARHALSAFTIVFTCLVLFTLPAFAKPAVHTRVRVIHASQAGHHIDGSLKDLAQELESVFRYTSYNLIQSKSMTLGYNREGHMGLPGGRTLVVIPTNISGKRIQYQIAIFKGKEQVFQTWILLKDRGSITIGGPRYQNGYLLFNISGSLQ